MTQEAVESYQEVGAASGPSEEQLLRLGGLESRDVTTSHDLWGRDAGQIGALGVRTRPDTVGEKRGRPIPTARLGDHFGSRLHAAGAGAFLSPHLV